MRDDEGSPVRGIAISLKGLRLHVIQDLTMPHVTPRRASAVRLLPLLAVLALILGGPPWLPGQAIDPPKALTTQERGQLEAQVLELNQAGYRAYQQGDLVKAVARVKESIRILEQLYPKDRFPQGHTQLACSLDNLGELLRNQGFYAEARAYHERALAMFQSLYPKDRYPKGHSDLAVSLDNLGTLLAHQSYFVEARRTSRVRWR